MKIKLKTAEIQEYVQAPIVTFPKYTTQLFIMRRKKMVLHSKFLHFE